MLVVFFAAFETATLFHHSNWRLPIRVERILNLILVTPRCTGFIIPSYNARPIQTGARCFVGGISCIAHCAETCPRTPSRLVSLHIAKKTNLPWGNSLRCRFVRSASGDYQMARSPSAQQDGQKRSRNDYESHRIQVQSDDEKHLSQMRSEIVLQPTCFAATNCFGRNIMSKRLLVALLGAGFTCATLSAQELPLIHQPTLTPQDSGTTNGLISFGR